jgi:NAD-dependent dihydropyrimidine dehydrogenase PreA subunit
VKDFRYLDNVATLALDEGRCVGCGLCLAVCPHGVFEEHAGKVRIADRDGCMECGGCRRNCPAGAIAVTPGVGCAQAIIRGWLTGSAPSCDCAGGECC